MTRINDEIYAEFTVKGIPSPLRFVQGGSMDIGEDKNKHSVTIPDFFIGQYPVTKRPVEGVSWYEADKFIKKINTETGKEFRLPFESEWEYAARGGKYNQCFKYCGSDDLKQVGWFYKNSEIETKPIGLLLANELGIYDMSGNVYEWCEDDWDSNFEDEPKKDGIAWVDETIDKDKADDRVIRGGYFFTNADACTTGFRAHFSPNHPNEYIGFRVVLTPVQ